MYRRWQMHSVCLQKRWGNFPGCTRCTPIVRWNLCSGLRIRCKHWNCRCKKRANFWRRPWNVLPKSLQKFGKMRMWTHCWYRLQQQCKAFRTFYKRSMKRMTLFPLAPQQRFSKMFSRFLLMTLYLPLNKKSNRPKSQGIRSYGTTCSKSFRLCFAL